VGIMSECDRLVGILLSLKELVDATQAKSTLNQLVNMAFVEASECLVRAGFEPARLGELEVADELGYFLDAKYRPSHTEPGTAGAGSRGGPHLRLVGS
jgi:hypothetical protein